LKMKLQSQCPEKSSISDEELMVSLGKGNPLCLEVLVERYKLKIINFVYRMVGDLDQAEDIAQEVFIRVYRHRERYQPIAKFSTWLYTIAANLAKSELRRRSIFNPISLTRLKGERLSSIKKGPDKALLEKELGQKIQEGIEKLKPKYRVPLILRDIEGLSYVEISQIVDCPLGTVKSRINRARLQLRERLDDYLG
jgi:RNA polymerase sigma-70 factor (ECF subfamily)